MTAIPNQRICVFIGVWLSEKYWNLSANSSIFSSEAFNCFCPIIVQYSFGLIDGYVMTVCVYVASTYCTWSCRVACSRCVECRQRGRNSSTRHCTQGRNGWWPGELAESTQRRH